MREHGFSDLADTVAGYMEKRSIPFKAMSGDEDPEGETSAERRQDFGANMHKDELIDYVLHELGVPED